MLFTQVHGLPMEIKNRKCPAKPVASKSSNSQKAYAQNIQGKNNPQSEKKGQIPFPSRLGGGPTTGNSKPPQYEAGNSPSPYTSGTPNYYSPSAQYPQNTVASPYVGDVSPKVS
ncbi:hypothetical protein HMI55_002322, partial [Coelomomyces lativittatus]